jgi:predicted ABC-type ATPase
MASWMWIIAGPNGAGKSTFAGPYLDDLHAAFPQDIGPDGLIRLNADERMLDLRRQFPDAAQAVLNRRAAEQIDAEVVRLIAEGRSFAVETVLSTPKYRDDVEAARAKGFHIGLIYVSIHPPELAPRRVSERVLLGGHDVDPATAVRRYHRSHEQLRWFAPRADFLMIFDNSDNQPGAVPVLLARRFPNRPLMHVQHGINPAVDQALSTLQP